MNPPIRVVLVDRHPLILQGIRYHLGLTPDITIVGTTTHGDYAQTLCEKLKPDVLIVDPTTPDVTPLTLIAYLSHKFPATQILLYSSHCDTQEVQTLLNAGVGGYVLKDESPEALVQAIRTVSSGAMWLSRAILNQVVPPTSSQSPAASWRTLKPREREILKRIGQGWDNSRIANAVCLAEQTVRNYTGHLFTAIGVRSRAEAVVWTQQHPLA